MAKRETKRKNNRGEKIDIQELLRSLDYLRWDHPSIMKGFKVVRELQLWLYKQCQPEHTPKAWITIADFGFCITIDDVCVFDSEHHDESKLTFNNLVEEYRDHVTYLMVPLEP